MYSRLNNPGVVAGNVSGTERAGGPNSFIRGLADEESLEFDSTFSDDLRNFLDAESKLGHTYCKKLISYNRMIMRCCINGFFGGHHDQTD